MKIRSLLICTIAALLSSGCPAADTAHISGFCARDQYSRLHAINGQIIMPSLDVNSARAFHDDPINPLNRSLNGSVVCNEVSQELQSLWHCAELSDRSIVFRVEYTVDNQGQVVPGSTVINSPNVDPNNTVSMCVQAYFAGRHYYSSGATVHVVWPQVFFTPQSN